MERISVKDPLIFALEFFVIQILAWRMDAPSRDRGTESKNLTVSLDREFGDT
jgi:hypothetical protein